MINGKFYWRNSRVFSATERYIFIYIGIHQRPWSLGNFNIITLAIQYKISNNRWTNICFYARYLLRLMIHKNVYYKNSSNAEVRISMQSEKKLLFWPFRRLPRVMIGEKLSVISGVQQAFIDILLVLQNPFFVLSNQFFLPLLNHFSIWQKNLKHV